MTSYQFPKDFLWGIATGGYQFEGGNENSQCYLWEQQKAVDESERAGDACDWWRNAERDLDLIRDLGVNALRLSVEWSRLEPELGKWDAAAFQRYREILQGARERGMEIMITLHHFSHPIWFEQRGGFLAPDMIERFASLAEHVVSELGDLCDLWCTFNEPNAFATFVYFISDFVPDCKQDLRAMIRAQGNVLRAHAAMYETIHRLQPSARVGLALSMQSLDPANPRNPLDRLMHYIMDSIFNDFIPHALHEGTVPPFYRLFAGNVRMAQGKFDYFGFNTYARELVRFDLSKWREGFANRVTPPDPNPRYQDEAFPFGQIYPMGIARHAIRAATYGKPIYVTEHGIPDATDRVRPWVLASAVRAMEIAREQGADLRGYFFWTIVDSYEWSEGQQLRYGLYARDPRSQDRHRRPSAGLYQAIAQARGLTPEMVRDHTPADLDELFPSDQHEMVTTPIVIAD